MALAQAVAFLFSFCLIVTKGSEVKQLFVRTGSDVTLDIMNPEDLKDYHVLQWRFNGSVLVTALQNGKVTNIKDRVVYHPQNSSVTVKDRQKEHSGLYQAQLTTDTGTPTISSYSITVQAPVSPVNLRVDSVSLSSESCNVTVSCTTESSSISRSFSCDRHTCEEPRPLTPDSALFLDLYLSDASVICNHSNHVSWKNDTKDIKQVCAVFGSKDPPEEPNGTNLTTVVIIVVTVLALHCLTGAFLCWKG